MTVLAIVFAAGLVPWLAKRREARAERSSPPEGRMLTVGNLRIHAVVQGSGPDLVLIHGASGNTRNFTHAFSALMARRYRVITLDRPGFGWSQPLPPEQDTLVGQAKVLQAAVAQLGALRPVVVGHSYGAAVALAWAAHLPEHLSALVTVGAVSMTWPGPVDRLYRITGSRLGSALVVPALTAFVPDLYVQRSIAGIFHPLPAPAGFVHTSGALLSLRRATWRVNARQRLALKDQIATLVPLYPGITLPVEIVHGAADSTTPPQVHALPLAAALPNAHLTLLEGVGHMPFHLDPEPLAQAIDRAATRAGLH